MKRYRISFFRPDRRCLGGFRQASVEVTARSTTHSYSVADEVLSRLYPDGSYEIKPRSCIILTGRKEVNPDVSSFP